MSRVQCTVHSSVADPHHLDGNPYPPFNCDADPNPPSALDPDPAFHSDSDSVPDPASQK